MAFETFTREEDMERDCERGENRKRNRHIREKTPSLMFS